MRIKTRVFMLALCICLGMTACGASSGKDVSQIDISGTWELEAVKLNGMTYVESEYLDRYDYSFCFSQDGQATATVLGVSYTTTYEIRDNWILFANAALGAVKLQIVDDRLELELGALGGGLVFVRKAEGTIA